MEWMEQKGKKSHGHGQQCGDCRGSGVIRELNDNVKTIIRVKMKENNKNTTKKLEEFSFLTGIIH